MPRKRKKVKERKGAVSEGTIEKLTLGFNVLDDWLYDPPPVTDMGELEELWWELRADILAAQEPYTRPWAWWFWEAPEPRRLLAGAVVSICKDTSDEYLWTPDSEPTERRFWTWFGQPRLTRPVGSPTAWETEADYLQRLGLLMKGKERRSKK